MSELNNIVSLFYFTPELIICFGIVSILIISVFEKLKDYSFIISLIIIFLSSLFIFPSFYNINILFLGNLIHDPFSNFFKLIFSYTTFIVICLTYYDSNVNKSDWPEYFSLLLITLLGMFLMSSSINLLMVYLAIELVSIPSYMLAGFNFNSKGSNEASLKYVLYGSFASGLMLFGISWLYGQTGSLYFYDIYNSLLGQSSSMTSIITFMMIFVGFGYKISSAPFHYWVPDVYQGAPNPITTFFSIAPKIAGLALLTRFLYTSINFIYIDWNLILAILSAATMTIGNILALRQTDVKRILAYSSISHIGFIMIGFAVPSPYSVIHMIFYAFMYMFMTLGAFSIYIFFYNAYNTEKVDEWSGLGYLHPFICSFMVINLVSLAGLPPTSGFVAKFYLLASLISSKTFYWLAVIAVINTVIALYYYFNLVRAMFLENELKSKLIKPNLFLIIIIVFNSIQGLIFYFYWSDLYDVIKGLLS